MPRWWTLEDVISMKQMFSYLVDEDGYAKILARFAEEHGTQNKATWRETG